MRVYFDNAATTKVDEEVYNSMLPYFREKYGNPSSIHSFGNEARLAVEKARERCAKALNAEEANRIIFTGSTTEANNLALFGAAGVLKEKGNHIVTSVCEHHAVLDVFKALEKEGFAVTYLGVNADGVVAPDEFEKAIQPDTVLASIMYANNEVGTIQPIVKLAGIARKNNVIFHTDAAAAKYLKLDVQELGVDLMSLGPHKFYGPKGVGVLYIGKEINLQPIILGGGHERGLRPGTENVPGIVGAGKALELLAEEQNNQARRVRKLRNSLIRGVLESVFDVQVTGHSEKRVPDIAGFVVKGVEGEALLLSLDREGIAASSGSACTSGELQPSHVLLAMGYKPEEAHGSLRFSLGKYNTEEEVDYVVEKLPGIVERLRKMAPE